MVQRKKYKVGLLTGVRFVFILPHIEWVGVSPRPAGGRSFEVSVSGNTPIEITGMFILSATNGIPVNAQSATKTSQWKTFMYLQEVNIKLRSAKNKRINDVELQFGYLAFN
ncbi:MAG: hypothetical protein WDO71_14040 [Bacteroidota bacterium]